VEIHVANPDHKLLPGMYVQVRFQSPSPIRLTLVPATAIQTTAAGGFIYTVDKLNRVHMHKLEIGRDLGGQVEVMKGIKPGDQVVVNPPDDLLDGSLVSPVLSQIASNGDEQSKK
jgi:multidrug efflux pump subunit AcrA (membrane-fusion protein)